MGDDMATMTQERLVTAINLAIEAELQKAIDEAAERAADEARKAVKERLGGIALQLTNQIDMERVGQTLTVRLMLE
jgi:hypothetical protein